MSRGICSFCDKEISDTPYEDKTGLFHVDCYRFRGWIKENKKKVKEVLNEKD